MSRIVKVKNNTGSGGTWVGRSIAAGQYSTLSARDMNIWKEDATVFADVASGTLVVNKGADTTDDISNAIEGWTWLVGDNSFPESTTVDGNKIAVHASSKPEPEGGNTYAVWTGAGDNVDAVDPADSIGQGDLLTFNMVYNTPVTTQNVKFDPRHGRVWIHEAYLKFENGGFQDFLTASIIAPPTPLQQAVDLDYVVEGDWVKYSPGGPGTGTHGLAGTPVLMPRTFSMDGDWDYDGVNLTPNFGGTGNYNITANEREAHRYFNKIPMFGSSTTYFSMTSEETAELPVSVGYFLRIEVHNNSNTNWQASVIMEIFRERTAVP